MTNALKAGDRTTIEYRDDGKQRDIICLRVPNPDPHILALDVSSAADADEVATYAAHYAKFVEATISSIQSFEEWLKENGVELDAPLPYRKFHPDFIK